MTTRHSAVTALACALAIGICSLAPTAAHRGEAPASPLRLVSGRVSLAGTSNLHAYTASTSVVRIVRLEVASGVIGGNVWEEILKPGAIEALEVAVPAATLVSDRDGLDKNMYRALKVTEHPDITFRLTRFQEDVAPGTLRANGMLKIAGVERDVVLDLTTMRTESTLTVKGQVQLSMPDFGITPPKAMLGMLKTDPKVTVTFEAVLAMPLT